MEKEFIPYEEALALKELGFDGDYLGLYVKNQVELLVGNNFGELGMYDIKAPLYQQAFRWFREKHNMLSFIEPANGVSDKCMFGFYITDDEQSIIWSGNDFTKNISKHLKSYEEAELACLKKLIEIVKKK